MSNIYYVAQPITQLRDSSPLPFPVTALAFDPLSDVLWTGSAGQVSAYYHNRTRGVYWRHSKNTITKLAAEDSHVRVIDAVGRQLGAYSKGGVTRWQYRVKSAAPLTTFCNSPGSTSTLVVGSTNAELTVLNASTGDVIRQVPSSARVTRLQSSSDFVLSGSADGYIRTHDIRTSMRRTENQVKAHQGVVQGLECNGNWIYSIGLGIRLGRPYPDPLVKLFDVRNLRPMSSFTFSAGPSLLNVLPGSSTSLMLSSTNGLVNIVDVLNPASGQFFQLDTQSYVTSSAVSPDATYIAIGDANGVIHLLSNTEDHDLPFNGFHGQSVEWADPPQPLPQIEWTDSTPLNVIGMPYYDDYLLSAYDADFQRVPEYYPPPAKIPVQVLVDLKEVGGLSYAHLPAALRGKRNIAVTNPNKKQTRFRSDKSRNDTVTPPDSPIDEQKGDQVPRHYRRVEIEYSKFGVEDFDFEFYNKSPFSGLETHIRNCYTNSLVQLMHYTLPIRHLAKSHITTPCQREHCMLCELGFVCRMLEDARGLNCHSGNFCKTITNTHNAQSFGVVDYAHDGSEPDYVSMIQLFNRFMIDHIMPEAGSLSNPLLLQPQRPAKYGPVPSPITQLLGIESISTSTCGSCGTTRDKQGLSHIVDMIYPRQIFSNETAPPSDFASILRNSLFRYNQYKTTCQDCKQAANFSSKRTVSTDDLPPLLLLNAAVYNEEHHRIWLNPAGSQGRFLTPAVGLDLHTEPAQPGGLVGTLSSVSQPGLVVYELRGLIISVKAPDGRSHLAAIIKVPEAEHGQDYFSPWFVFNDFAVKNVSESEALTFPAKWKTPCVLMLERVDMQSELNYSALPMAVDPVILSEDISLSPNRDKKMTKHELLSAIELPRPGTVVAIDAEFVQMQQEEVEYHTDGTRKVILPARLSLARVSVLREGGTKEGKPFIDDYIHTTETIVDHLTEFSGIQPGDLHPLSSPHTLVPLKVAYKKLRLLVDMGCIFVGHGLKKDFRIINIFVPPDQVIDTVDLYFIRARQRRLSLRFITWYILKEDIQQETHDSIEDARSALLLYKAYQNFEEENIFDEKLDELYRVGKEYNWKPPGAAHKPIVPAAPTPGYPQSPTLSNYSPVASSSSITPGHVSQSPFQAFAIPNTPSPPPFMFDRPRAFLFTPSILQSTTPPPQHQRSNSRPSSAGRSLSPPAGGKRSNQNWRAK